MIASVSGTVLACSPGTITIEVGGVGLLVHTTSRSSAEMSVGEQSKLNTVLVVREDSLTLFGFKSAIELETFELLRSVNGVGPKSALAILSSLTVQQITEAVASDRDEVFKSVSGVGAKTAKLITVSLSGKLSSATGVGVISSGQLSAVSALVGLGYSDKEATRAVGSVSEPGLSDQDILRLALQQLAKGSAK